jgi:hypothetical protein
MTKRTENDGRRIAAACVLGALVCLSALGDARLHAQANEPLLGTWVMDRARSTFSGVAPDSRTMTFERQSDGSIRHVTATSTTGGFLEDAYRLQYTFKVDGKEYPADPQMPLNTVSFKRVDANTVQRSGTYRGQIVETVTYAVSADGKTLTVTQMGMQDGAEVSSVQLFTRQ